jgi:hypothetical protein
VTSTTGALKHTGAYPPDRSEEGVDLAEVGRHELEGNQNALGGDSSDTSVLRITHSLER